MSSANRLTDDRLASIEQGALERYTLLDRVVIELVGEVRRLRQIVADDCVRTDVDHSAERA
jgi:hypothetical protein